MDTVSPAEPATKIVKTSRTRVRQGSEPNWRPELVRQRINIGQQIRRLEECAAGLVEYTPARLKAIELLLSKALPNLNAVDVNIDGTATINVISDKPRTIYEWEADAARYLVASAGTAEAPDRLPSP